MKTILLFTLFLTAISITYAQDDYFDMPTMTSLISHNKQNFADHQELRDNQLASQVTVSA